MIKLVLSDVDGTLIPFGAGGASERTMRSIHAAQDAGVRFGVSTGRDVVELMELFHGDDEAFRTGILSNGKKIMKDGDLAQLTLLDNEALRRAHAAVAQFPHTIMTAYPYRTDATNPIYCMDAVDELDAWAQKYAFSPRVVDEVPDEPIIGATIATNAPEEMLDDLRSQVLAACPEFDIAKPAERWWDILPKGLNKGSALQVLLQKLGIAQDEVVVFGDADNDLAILLAVENSVAVANATPAVQAAAQWHIGPSSDDAVAQALDDIVAAAKDGSVPVFMRK